ncbi:MAG: NADPH-dependent FMN reductase, partial [Steroidobacteraceae bacterium]
MSTPEYARGYPGALKNALDWLVNTDAFVNKPFMLLNASSRSTVAQETLVTVLQTMSGIHVQIDESRYGAGPDHSNGMCLLDFPS